MTIQLVTIGLDLNTSQGRAGYATRFGAGLNVLNADNTWGKSTLLQSIVYALGLEGALTTSRRSPMGPAMTQAIDSPLGHATVIESSVTLTIKNDRDQFLRVRRWVVSHIVDSRLVYVWQADTEAGLDSARRQEMYVRDPGSTVSDVGFHRLLEQYIGWTLPKVPSFEGGEARLYLEVLLPLFYVEQKFGWSGVAPRVPTHFRIRDPLKRAMEYILGLHTLDQLRRREALREEEAALRMSWAEVVARARESAAAEDLRLALVDERPVSVLQRRPIQIEAFDGNRWVSLDSVVTRWSTRLQELAETSLKAGPRTERTRAELRATERDVAQAGAMVRIADENLVLAQADRDALVDRLASVIADRVRLLDVRKIQTLGGELDLLILADGQCPTCSQQLDGRHVATSHVATLEDNIRLADAERTTLQNLISASYERVTDLESQKEAALASLRAARNRVRAMRDELVGASDSPSLAEVQQRLQLEGQMRGSERVRDTIAEVDEQLTEAAEAIDDLRRRLAALDAEPEVASDAATIRDFEGRFQNQLAAYGLRSLGADEVSIDARTFLPVSDGFELSFDIALGMSASDSIRTKWAYHTSVVETAANAPGGRSFGVLVLDEPRQQETNRESLAALLRRLNNDQGMSQILYATSERPDELSALLAGLEYTTIPAAGPHLLTLLDDSE